jgi:hypothetical protein
MHTNWMTVLNWDEVDSLADRIKRAEPPVQRLRCLFRFPLAIYVSYQQGNRGKHSLFVCAYTVYDLSDRTPKDVEALYQKRSVIETAFRTMREARARTTIIDRSDRSIDVRVGELLGTEFVADRSLGRARHVTVGEQCLLVSLRGVQRLDQPRSRRDAAPEVGNPDQRHRDSRDIWPTGSGSPSPVLLLIMSDGSAPEPQIRRSHV